MDSVIHISPVLDYLIDNISHSVGRCLLLIWSIYSLVQLSARQGIQRGVIFMVISIILAHRLSKWVNAVLHLVRGDPQVLRVAYVLRLSIFSFKQALDSVFVAIASNNLAVEAISNIFIIVKCKNFRSNRRWLLGVILYEITFRVNSLKIFIY